MTSTNPLSPTGAMMSAVETETPAMPTIPMPWDLVPYLVAAALLVALIGMITGAVRRALPGARRKPKLPLGTRAKLRIHPGPGWIGGWKRWRALGLPAARRVAKIARPSLSWWDRHRPGGWREYATQIGTAWGWVVRRRVVATGEDTVLTIAGPRMGKSAASACRIIDAPGPVIATSIRDDALKLTVGPRSTKGRVFVLNPEQVGSYASTMRYHMVGGCEDAQTAIRKAGHMVYGQASDGLSDADFWSDQSAVALAGLLHAAALAGYGMDHVYAWALGTDDTPVRVLRQAKSANAAQRDDVANFLEAMPERTKGSVATTLRRTLQFMRDPEIAALLSPRTDPQSEMYAPQWFDITDFVTGGSDTLYLISSGADSVTAPLFSALVAEIAHAAYHEATQMGGRLDPPLDLELDEVTNVAPVPVDSWVTWMGGAGIRIRAYAQSWAQLVARYGKDGAESIWSCSSMVVTYGGINEPELLGRIKHLAGTTEVRGRDQRHRTYDQSGNRVTERVPTYETVDVIPSHELKLDRHWAVVISRGTAPCLVQTPKAWKRRDVRRWRNRTPDCVRAPDPRAVPEVDPGLRQRLEQDEQAPGEVQPLRAVATGTDGPVEATSSASADEENRRRSGAADEATQPMRSMRSGDLSAFVRRTGPDRRAKQPPAAPGGGRSRAQERPQRAGSPPPLRRAAQPGEGTQPVPGRLHPAPWDLPYPPRSGAQEDQEQPVDPPASAGRLPWDDWEH